MSGGARTVGAAVAAAAVSSAVARRLRRRPPGGRSRWVRSNFRGREVDLLAGPAAAAGAVTGALLGAGRRPAAAGLLTATAGVLGLYDDLGGSTHARGLRGHLAALGRGEVTTGLVKLAGLGGASFLAACASDGNGRRPAPVDVAVDTMLVSGTANLVNLLDLRPGRALKAVTAVAVPVVLAGGPGRPVAAAAAGTAVVLLPADLGERSMVGDCGANALGTALGVALTSLPRPVRVGTLAVVVALTLVSERVSFSAVIERQPVLAAVDGWGRLPA